MADPVNPGAIASSETSGLSKAKGCIRSWKPWTWYSRKNKILDISGIASSELVGTPFNVGARTRQIYNLSGIVTGFAAGIPEVSVPSLYYSIPDQFTYPWYEYCGIPGGIPFASTIYRTFSPGDPAESVNAAIVSASAVYRSSGILQVIMLEGGEYHWTGILEFLGTAAGVIVRGEGPGVTRIISSQSTATRFYGNSFRYTAFPGIDLSSGYTKGSTQIVLNADPSSYFQVGRLICITQVDDPDFYSTGIGVYRRNENMLNNPVGSIFPGMWDLENYRNLRFVTRIVAMGGAGNRTITISSPLPTTYKATMSPRAYPCGGASPSMCGIEELSVTFEAGTRERAFYFYGADRCWAKNVEYYDFASSYGASLFSGSSQCEMNRFYAHDCVDYPAQADGYPYCFTYGSTCCKIEDGIAYRTAGAIANGASACVVINNYIRLPGRANGSGEGESTRTRAAWSCNHGPFSFGMLYEGNIGSGFHSDGYHGGSGPIVLFRNHFNGLGWHVSPSLRKVIDLERCSYYVYVVGNVIGDPSWIPTLYEWTTGQSGSQILYVLGIPGMDSMSCPNNLVFDFVSGPGSAPVDYLKNITWAGSPVADRWGHYVDPDVLSTVVRHANYDYYPPGQIRYIIGESTELPYSLYYPSKPGYFGSLSWPNITPDESVLVSDNPAKRRWENYNISGNFNDLFADMP